MEISAKVICDSIGKHDVRLTTLQLHYHRYILPEYNTHRALTRNGASSRAIPTARLLSSCAEEMVEPLEWGLAQSGMQAFTTADEALTAEGRAVWNEARADAMRHAAKLNELGFAKQIVNRVIEPFLSTRTVTSATDWANFMALRDHRDAQPEIRDLAQKMKEAMTASTPKQLDVGDWHLPYWTEEDEFRLVKENQAWVDDFWKMVGPDLHLYTDKVTAAKAGVSAARLARVSYLTHDGKLTDYKDDIALFQRLLISQPLHASPAEHPARCSSDRGRRRNFRGWLQLRAMLPNDTVKEDA